MANISGGPFNNYPPKSDYSVTYDQRQGERTMHVDEQFDRHGKRTTYGVAHRKDPEAQSLVASRNDQHPKGIDTGS